MASAAPEIPVLARDQAFETIYRRYVKDVYHYALALLRNPADAEDVTQTTFLNAYRAYKRGDEILKPQNWLIKIAHNVARTRYARASRRVKEVPLEDHVDQLAVPEDERPNVEGVLRALGRLPFNQRAALVMRELEGRSYVEIADTLDVSVPAVETLIFRARRSLRMRSDALRSLAVVPLPGSLTRLFGGGGGVVAGGTAVGSGFVVKAAVALLAGAFVTGIGSERSRPAEAAAKPGSPGVSSSAWSFATPAYVRQAGSAGSARGVTPATRSKTKARTKLDRTVLDPTSNSSHTTASTSGQATTSEGTKSSPLTTTIEKVTQPLNDVVDTVNDTVDTAVTTLPPVQAPTLPPVEVPSPPPLPPVPTLP